MSCVSQMKYFKQGDSFYLEIEMLDSQTNLPVEITNEYTISASLNNRFGVLVADFEIVEYDQLTNKGKFALSFDDTTDWPLGLAKTDIKIVINNLIRHSKTIEFNIVRSETL